MGDAFSFSLLSIPYVVLQLMLSALALSAVLIRGIGIIRVATILTALSAMPYAVGMAVTASCDDPALVLRISRFTIGTISFVGPALMLLMLAFSGRLERYRYVLLLAIVISTATCVLTWSTDLVLRDPWQTSWGLWYATAGPLNDLQPGSIVVWVVVGLLLNRRGGAPILATARMELHSRRIALILVLAALSTSDALLAHGHGVYPFSFLIAYVAVGVGLWSILRLDMLHSRGFDHAAAIELAMITAMGGLLWLLIRAIDGTGLDSPVGVAAIGAPVLAITQLLVVMARGHFVRDLGSVSSDADMALEEFVEASSQFRDERALAGALSALVTEQGGLREPRLYVTGDGGAWRKVGDAAARPLVVDARVRAWLTANRAPILGGDLPAARLGGLRAPVESFLRGLDADVVVPLVDRDVLVGALVSVGPPNDRALRDGEAELITQAAAATAKALTYIALFREAAQRIELAKEVEVAAAVQEARAPGEVREHFSRCEIITHYQPSPRFGGDWWSQYELPDGRIFVAIGDVSGRGVPAALVSSTVSGACETAQRMLGAGFELLALLELLDRSVRVVGQDQYTMSVFAAVFDLEARKVTFANAGHHFPYVVRRATGGRAELRALVSRGTPLGMTRPQVTTSSFDLAPDDLIVFYSDALVDSPNEQGETFGERRLQRLLRDEVRNAGAGACKLIAGRVHEFRGGAELLDDVTLMVMQLQA